MRIREQLARRRWLMAMIPVRRGQHKATSRMQQELTDLTTAQLRRELRAERQIARAERIGQQFAADMGM